MRILEGKRRLALGCCYTMSPANRGLVINMSLVIRWYAWPFMMLKAAHMEYSFKWYQYPKLLFLIAYHSIKKWCNC